MSGSEQVNMTEDVRRYAAEKGVNQEQAIEEDFKEKAAEFVQKGAAVYAKG
jgi:phosphomethylpyrimidine synthase